VADKEKPYKLYRGGRVKGPIRPERDAARPGIRRDGDGGVKKPGRRRPRWRRLVVLFLVGLVLLVVAWVLLGYLAVRRGVEAANDRLPEDARRALTPQDGSILSSPSNVLVLGADVGRGHGRDRPGLADSIMLVRTDPDEGRVAYLAIPRDLRIDIPGRGSDRINAAYALGGPALAIDTVESLTGLPVNHVVVVDFASFSEVVDAVGGITVDNPTAIRSNAFDCPYRERERCATFAGWNFRKGEIELDGRRALVYARIRKNQLDPSESDITRGQRQQRVIQGIMDRVVGFNGLVRMPFVGDDLVEPLATDLSTGELLQLGWVRWRAADEKTLRCGLGGEPTSAAGAAVLQPSEDNALVIAMITGQTAPQPPPPNRPFAPGCFTGRAGS
jgi:polyisoprenyl-teichoic acid--peptidoglycan teichoic acid transferase